MGCRWNNAPYQVDLHQLEGAIETLERGRALLWSEMRHFRASTGQLLQADPQLGRRFAAVNRDLDELTKSIPPSHKLSMDDGGIDDVKGVDPFSRFLLKQRGVLKERDKLSSQIQVLPGFDNFLRSPFRRLVGSCHYHQPLQMALRHLDPSPHHVSLPHSNP